MKTSAELFAQIALYISLLAASSALAQPSKTHKTAKAASAPASGAQQSPGERKFQANCSRCHSAPEALSPQISGTVMLHMRVRASLSAKDEQEILRFLAP